MYVRANVRDAAPGRPRVVAGSCPEKVTDGLVNRLIAVTHTLKTVTCHSGRYRGILSEVKVYMYLGRRPESDAAEISKTTPL